MLLPVHEEAKQSTIDRAAFTTTKEVAALRVPKQRCQELMRKFRGYTLNQPKLKCIAVEESRPETRLLLLTDTQEMPEGLSDELKGFIAAEGFEVVKNYQLRLDYSLLNADQVLKAVLPEGVDAPSSFETIGHIIHLNLRENQLPYKYLIGQVLLDKNPHVKTVVNKVGNIDNTFRVFAMELLAGEPQTEAEVVQHGLRFRLDMAQVYWNSRLEAEHHRLVQQYFKPGDVIADIMAGVGPFAIPAAVQGCKVYANDLNPSSTHYLRINARLNHVADAVHVFTLDGRDFVRLLCSTPGHSILGATTSAPEQPCAPASQRQDTNQAAAAQPVHQESTHHQPSTTAIEAQPQGHAQPTTAAGAAPQGHAHHTAATGVTPQGLAQPTSAGGSTAESCSQGNDGVSSGAAARSQQNGAGDGDAQSATGRGGSGIHSVAAPTQHTGGAGVDVGAGASRGGGKQASGAPATMPAAAAEAPSANVRKQPPKKRGAQAAKEVQGPQPPIPHGFQPAPGGILFQHAVMNLPASAIEFLDAFNGAFDPQTWRGRLPLVHLYTFKPAAESEADVLAKAERIMGGRFESSPAVHLVRDVSPGKVMLCITFRVPEAVAFNGREEDGSGVAERGGGGQGAGIGSDALASEAKRQRT